MILGTAALYPLFLCLEHRPVTVIGGGSVATRKVQALISSGARITVITPEASESIAQWSAVGTITWFQRGYVPGDLADTLLVICATNDESVNKAVFEEALTRNILVNVVDIPSLCNAYVPSVLRRGKLQIAVSTSGAAPSIARDIRKKLESEFPVCWEEYLDLMAEVRTLVKQRISGPADKRARLLEAIDNQWVFSQVEQGNAPRADQIYDRFITPLLEEREVIS